MRIKLMKQRLMIIIGFVLLCLQILKAQEKVNIWQGTACRKNVEMTAYLAKVAARWLSSYVLEEVTSGTI